MAKILTLGKILSTFVSIAALLAIQGCGQVGYHELLPTFMPQHPREKSNTTELLNQARKNNLRSESVYRQFQTVALFDALLYSKSVVSVTAQIKADKYGVTMAKARQELIESEVQKASKELVILLQADIRKAIEPDLSKTACPWTFSLQISDGKTLTPTIDKVKHSQITKSLFGHAYSRHKTLYKLSFGLPAGKSIPAGPVKLVCRSSQNELELAWPAVN